MRPLVRNPPSNAANYRFESVAVKEPTFAIDGIFHPPEGDPPGVVYFCEVQFQRDATLYERLFSELFLYFYRHRRRYSNWQAVVIYPSRSTQQRNTLPYDALLNSPQVDRIYLDELGNIDQLPLEVAMMVLTTLDEGQAPSEARALVDRAQQERSPAESQVIIELVRTILIYKFKTLSREEVEAMIGVRLEDIRVCRELKEEGRQEGIQEGRQEGRREEAAEIILRLLNRRCGVLSEFQRGAVTNLTVEKLEQLSEALLDFTSSSDLDNWLDA